MVWSVVGGVVRGADGLTITDTVSGNGVLEVADDGITNAKIDNMQNFTFGAVTVTNVKQSRGSTIEHRCHAW